VGAELARVGDKLRDRARELRRDLTEAERRLWEVLRAPRVDGCCFRRQHPIPPYVADFACADARLIVEVDGGQDVGSGRDAARDEYLVRRGWRAVRFWNNDLLENLEGCAERIAAVLKEPPPPPSPARAEGRGYEPQSAVLSPPSPEAGEGGGLLLRATAVITDSAPFDTVTLAYDDRHRRRVRLVTDGGLPFLLDLPEARVLRDGDRLTLDDGRLVLVRAMPEAVLEVRAGGAAALARVAWHLGNRHTPTQILDGALRIRADHVLEHLLVEHLGAEVVRATAPFDPEGGAYGAHGHAHD
jgi:urease accessory protein